jgi:hypothetical protein
MEGRVLGQVSQRDIDALSKARRIYIATVRKDGNQSKAVPVWFTSTPEHLVLLQTGPTTWTATRIRRGSPVIVWIGKRKGPALIGRAEVTRDPGLMKRIADDYPRRYLLARLQFFRPRQERFDNGEIIAIKITPILSLPDGFGAEPGKRAPSLSSANTQGTALTGD